MYIPKHFAIPLPVVHELMPKIDHGNLVTSHDRGPVATLLPVHHRSGEGYGSLITHMSRVNPQWQEARFGETLLVSDLADHYIDPTWSAGFIDAPRVPTWNYLTLHCYGELVVHEDPDWTLLAVTELCDRNDFALDVVPEELVRKQLRAIVGVELRISRVEAKAKLGQNLKPEDILGHIAGLEDRGATELAQVMRELSVPYAEKRWLDISALRARVLDGGENR